MKINKYLRFTLLIILGFLSTTVVSYAEEADATLTQVADLKAHLNANNISAGTAYELTPQSDIQISGGASALWQLSVEIKQPIERGTRIELGAQQVNFKIDTAGAEFLQSFNPDNVLSSQKILDGKGPKMISANQMTSKMTLGGDISQKPKGVYFNSIIYTLTPDIADSYTVTFDSNEGNYTPPAQTIQKYGTVVKPDAPTKEGFEFVNWYADGSMTPYNFSTPVTKDVTLRANWKERIEYKVQFKDFDGTNQILSERVVKAGESLEIPAAPAKDNYYFLGWAETANAANSASLYVPSGYQDIRNALNTPDKTYLGYPLKSENSLTNIKSNITLHAVYYKQLKATAIANPSNPKAQEFIWNNAIWRVLNPTENGKPNRRLIIKVNALTTAEATGTGATNDYYAMPFLSATAAGALGAGSSIGNRGYYYFDSDGSNGYEDSGLVSGYGLKSVIDYYYGTISAEAKNYVLPVNLNNPDLATFKSKNSLTLTYSNGSGWSDYYKDTDFATTITTGVVNKQAFALSYGDINSTMGLSGSTSTDLLKFSDSNINYFWLRSVGSSFRAAGYVYQSELNGICYVYDTRPVRPALWVTLEPEQLTVDFNSNGGSGVASVKVNESEAVAEPVAPTKSGYVFKGWYTDETLTSQYNFETPVTTNMTLYAKWIPAVGTEISFAESQWRVLKVDNDNKALIIKVNALTEREATGTGATTGYYETPFLSATAAGALGAGSRDDYYFDSDGSNGYEDSGANSYSSNTDPKYKYGLKGAIDYYYNNTISPSYSDYVLPVNLNNPDLATFKSINDLTWSYNSGGGWDDYNKDADFATTLDGSGSKQAFALSYGDINSTMGFSGSVYSGLLVFSGSNDSSFWLRSVGHGYIIAGWVNYGDFKQSSTVYNINHPVRPALWISLGS